MSEESQPTFADSSLAASIHEMVRALDVEIGSAMRDPDRALDVFNGSLMADTPTFLYRFSISTDPPLAAETPVKVRVGDHEPLDARVVSVDDFELWIECTEQLPEPLAEARITTEPWFILRELGKRLAFMLEAPVEREDVLTALLGRDLGPTEEDTFTASGIFDELKRMQIPPLIPNDAQQLAIARCISNPLHFVWGPPGTGKTASVAQMTRALLKQNERVLLLAHSNAAIDVATLRIVEAFSDTTLLEDGKLLRAGTAQSQAVRDIPQLSPEHVAGKRDPELHARKKQLESMIRRLKAAIRTAPSDRQRNELGIELSAARGELRTIRDSLKDAIAQLLAEASVVTATLSRFAIDPSIWNLGADAVIIDEASMAPLAFTFAAAYRAQQRVLFFGDFRQLSPIVVSNRPEAREWIGRDAFDSSGVKANIDLGFEEPRVTMLDLQYRMAEPIAEVVSGFAYDGLLRTAEGVRERTSQLKLSLPFPGDHVTVVDTSELRSACSHDARLARSRINPLHAVLSCAFAEKAVRDPENSVAIITPYKAQARMTMRLVREVLPGASVRTATVHRFQGAEDDIVIIDLVDAFPQRGASVLTGKDADATRRILNVAVSRARGKLIILADLSFTGREKNSPLIELLDLLEVNGRVWRGADVLREVGDSAFVSFQQWNRTLSELRSDLAAASGGTIGINLPRSLPLNTETIDVLRNAAERSQVTVNCGPEVAVFLEDTSIDVRLRILPVGFTAVVAGDSAFIGGIHTEGCFARLGEKASRALLPDREHSGELVIE